MLVYQRVTGKFTRTSEPLYLMVKTMVSGLDFPNKTNPLNIENVKP
jgi:hypothetical protein